MPRLLRPVVVATVASCVLASLAAAAPSVAASRPAHRAVHETARPDPVRDVAAYVAGNTITVDWKNPGSAFDRLIVRYRKGSTAPTITTGSAVHLNAARARSATLRHLADDTTYAVSVWTKSGHKLSSKRTTAFTTDDHDRANGTYLGTVTDTAGAPLAHARITLISNLSGADFGATTDSSGHVSRVLPAGLWLAVVDGSSATGGNSDSTGYVANLDTFRVRAGHDTAPAAIVLMPGAELTGRVTDQAGEPLAGVDVTPAQPMPYAMQDTGNGGGVSFGFLTGSSQVVSAPDGSYRLRGVPTVAIQVCFDPTQRTVTGGSATDYLARCTSDTVDLSPGVHSSMPDSQLRTGAGGAVAGKVKIPSGKGARNVFVDAFKRDGDSGGLAETDADGRYHIGGLEPGDYQVCFVPTGITGASRSGFRRSCPATPLVVATNATTTANRTLQRGGAITGRVTGPAGHALAGVAVYTHGGSYAETDSRGHYTIAGVAPHRVRVCFDTSSSPPRKGTTGARPGCLPEKIEVKTGRVRTGGDIALKRGGAVTGVITNSDGTPARNVDVDLERFSSNGIFDGEATTDKNGRYTIGGAPAGRYQLCVLLSDDSDNQRTSCRNSVLVTNGKFTDSVDKVLPPMGTVAVTAQDAGANPVAGVDVVVLKACTSAGGADCDHLATFGPQTAVRVAATGMTAGDGTVTYPLLKPGTYGVCLLAFYGSTTVDTPPTGFADACESTSFDVPVTAGTSTPVTQTLKLAGAITGKVTDSAGHPIRGAVVHVSGSAADDFSPSFPFGLPGDPLTYSTTAADGTYTIRSVTPGSQTVCVDASTAKGGSSDAGYLKQCLGGEPGVSTGGTTVSIKSNKTTTAPDVVLTSAAGISGRITSTGKLGFPEVTVWDSSGSIAAYDGVDPDGKYRFTGLRAGSYRVCVQDNHDSRCYVNVPWTTRKPPAKATPVITTAGAMTSGIDVKLHD